MAHGDYGDVAAEDLYKAALSVEPSDAVTLVRGLQQFPGQSARQVRGFIVESAPSDDPSVVGRFDKKQAASLYMGSVQFGYFIATIFRGQADLDPQAVLSLEEAMAIKQDIQKSTREMRSEAAWAAASRRAGPNEQSLA